MESPTQSETPEQAKTLRVKKKRLVVRLLIAAACLATFVAAFLLSVPFIVTHIPIPDLEFDVSQYLEGVGPDLVSNKTVTAMLNVHRGNPDGFRIRAKGRLLDWPYSLRAQVRFGFVRAQKNH